MGILNLGLKKRAKTAPAKDGVLFLILTFIVGFAALNTGNNLIYLIFGMMISLVVVSGILSMINLSGIELELKRLPSFFAMTPATGVFTIRNSKYIPSYALTVRMGKSSNYVSWIPSGGQSDVRLNCTFKNRGWSNLPELTINTKFPFGFFRKWIKVNPGIEKVLVYPRVYNISTEKTINDGRPGEIASSRTGLGEEFKSIREYEIGDNTKHIDWKKTAKTGRTMVREYYSPGSRVARVVFTPESESSEDIERYISEKASLVISYLNLGYSVEFVTDNRSIITNKNNNSVSMVLRYLALY